MGLGPKIKKIALNVLFIINDKYSLAGAASTVINPIVRFVLPDLELGTVMEEESVGADTDAEDNTENFAYNVRRRKNQCKRFSHYKPSDQYRKKKTKYTENKGLEKDSIRKEVVGDDFLFLKISYRDMNKPRATLHYVQKYAH